MTDIVPGAADRKLGKSLHPSSGNFNPVRFGKSNEHYQREVYKF